MRPVAALCRAVRFLRFPLAEPAADLRIALRFANGSGESVRGQDRDQAVWQV
ncbi:MAG: hypothetical protein OXU61_01890 [Gammaproteobacteria bacterium]|nr:hypothetical protein [Gammaproteobacteria bacterium]